MAVLLNRGQCRLCGDIIESKTRHDMVWCTYGAVAVDGGRDYLRRAGNPWDFIELSILDTTEQHPVGVKGHIG